MNQSTSISTNKDTNLLASALIIVQGCCSTLLLSLAEMKGVIPKLPVLVALSPMILAAYGSVSIWLFGFVFDRMFEYQLKRLRKASSQS